MYFFNIHINKISHNTKLECFILIPSIYFLHPTSTRPDIDALNRKDNFAGSKKKFVVHEFFLCRKHTFAHSHTDL